jgi:hypothetical protein
MIYGDFLFINIKLILTTFAEGPVGHESELGEYSSAAIASDGRPCAKIGM